jgi:hypothetical protein
MLKTDLVVDCWNSSGSEASYAKLCLLKYSLSKNAATPGSSIYILLINDQQSRSLPLKLYIISNTTDHRQ